MEVTARKLIVAAALLALAISPAAAGHPLSLGQTWGRWIGYGWGDGYHAHDEAPPRRHHAKRAQQRQWQGVMPGPAMMPPPRNTVEVLPLPLPGGDLR